MAGHSKWANIKQRKTVTDAKKAKVFSKISRMISVAVRERGVSPDTNLALRLAITKAREANMPRENIDRIIKKYSGGEGEGLEAVQFEAYGPGGTALIIDVITDSRNRTAQEVRHLLSSHGGTLATPGSVVWMFQRYGKFTVPSVGASPDDIELAAIESGAQDTARADNMIVVLTQPDALHKVAQAVRTRGFAPDGESFEFIPSTPLTVTDVEAQQQLDALLAALDDHDDVQDIYTNLS
ncbi:MAG: YebC/PmpR family DNA-binding transcriptional regulator [Patescibacteria group bacterium]